MAQKRIIILNALPGVQAYRYALWAVTPASRQAFYANLNAKSAWKDIAPAELTALQNGSIVEKVDSFSNPTSLTLAQIKSQLEAIWTAYQAFVTAYNPWDRYGSFFDDTSTWTNGGVS